MKKNKNSGFSLIELIIAISVLLVLSGLLFMNIGVSKEKEGAGYSRELCNQIRLMQTVSMSKAGRWRLVLYERDGSFYCVQEKLEGEDGTGGGTGDGTSEAWNPKSEETAMGKSGSVTYTNSARPSETSDSGTTLIGEWRFDKDTGACLLGAGTVEIETAGKKRIVTIYGTSGYCEEMRKAAGRHGKVRK